MHECAPLLQVSGIDKAFGVVQALKDVRFTLRAGEVHSLMGENGAGKSTLSKIIAGIYPPDAGTILFEGQPVKIESPADAIRMGIAIVMQEFNSLPEMTVYENVYLGHADAYRRGFILDKANCIRRTRELLAMFGMEGQINPSQRLSSLSVAEQQIIEIIKAVSYDSKIIILDEPTASLTSREADKLFEVVRNLKARGVGFIVVSHRISEVFAISDRITVLRDGQLVLDGAPIAEMDEKRLVNAMVGREITDYFGAKEAGEEDLEKAPRLKVEHLADQWGFIKDLSFTAYTGEITGIAGLVGAGRTTLVRCLFGAEARSGGRVTIDDVEIKPDSPEDAIAKGLALVTENRKEEGLLIEMPIFVNTAFAKTTRAKKFALPFKQEMADCREMIKRVDIRTKNPRNPAKSLSGGNQQKVVVAKWLLTDPKVLILDEPTRGIDVLAKAEIYGILHRLVMQGVCIIIVSSELPEILGISDRVLVMRDGAITADMRTREATEESIISAASFGTPIGGQE